MRVLLCGGGTSGHTMPALAIAEYVKKRANENEILFIGRSGGDENLLITNSGFRVNELNVCGFKRSLSPKNVSAAFKSLLALGKSFRIIKDFSPDVVIGTGGYVCWPVLKAAQIMKIPTMLHESNAYPGLTTRLLAAKCDTVLLNVETCKENLKKKENVLVVGNPLRERLLLGNRRAARQKLKLYDNDIFILSFGGSGGADVMNSNILPFMRNVSQKNKRVHHLHGTGRKYYANASINFPDLVNPTDRCRIVPFIEDVPTYMQAADIVISRAGAMTLSEISCARVASVLIPSPNVTDNHQLKNARVYKNAGATILIEESELNEKTLSEQINKLINDRVLRNSLANAARRLQVPNSVERIYEETTRVIQNKNK